LLNNPNPVSIQVVDWYFEDFKQKNSINITLEKVFENEESEKNKIEEIFNDNIYINSDLYYNRRLKNSKLLLRSGFQVINILIKGIVQN
jgi:hypothetical protein